MSTERERHASLPSTSPEDNALFLDIMHEAPLFGHRKSRSLFGSVFYLIILVGYASLAVASPWIFHPIRDLIPQFFAVATSSSDSHRHLSAVSGIPSSENTLTGYVHQYNSLNSQPDVLKSLYSPLQPSSSLEGLRYHDAGRLSDQQMALLQYQRENLHFLSEEILRLQECLSKYERTNDGSTPQVDLAHLLAARDQELRTVSAEMNQLQSELRLARSLIAERDSESQKVRTTNNQYVEENERLRAILGEWSTRAAKLERALEAERMSNLELQKKIPTLRSHSQSSSEPTK
ncbi:uncharacterized protein Pyn_27523 [Prunus yedoensis var. nudiflora]|uniref:Uncharacterized protein n=1 Tax=Prunus yedoensis var. nudiflora TaxID=2094558 RepID=A0A314YFD2_PRUYE|nr:uncharacterized protein Pyn_27523 [Prunus yedoensis var. nudiflora]